MKKCAKKEMNKEQGPKQESMHVAKLQESFCRKWDFHPEKPNMNQRQRNYSGLKRSSHGLWMNG